MHLEASILWCRNYNRKFIFLCSMLGFNICFCRTETLDVEDQDREFPIAVRMSKTKATRPIQDWCQDQNSDLQSDQELDSKNCVSRRLKTKSSVFRSSSLLCGVAARKYRKVFRIGTVSYNWPMSAHASQAFSIAHCTDSEDLPKYPTRISVANWW